MGTDKLQCLLVFGVFVDEGCEKGLDDIAGLVLYAIHACDIASGQVILLHFTFSSAQLLKAIPIPLLAALAGFLIFKARLAVGAAAADFLRAFHKDALPSEQ